MWNAIEIATTITTPLCVVLTARQHIACWPTGLVAVILYSYLFYQAELYSDFGLQIYYIVVQLYGWHHWLHGGERRNSLPVTRLPAWHNVAWVAETIAGTIAPGFTMATYHRRLEIAVCKHVAS